MPHDRATPQLRRWIVQQIEAGNNPTEVLKAMMGNGWSEAAALDVMERTLRIRVAQINARNSAENKPK